MKHKPLYVSIFALFLLFFLLRVMGVFFLSVQVDEIHWRERSLKVINQFETHHYNNLTTHLGQPGLPPGVIMAGAMWLSKEFNLIGLKIGDIYYDYLHAARIACAFFSSLIVIPMMMLGKRLFGLRTAIFSAFMLSFAPHHLGLSSMAHLDSIMSLFVMYSALFYFLAQQEGILKYKVYAGVFWGLAIATKPTAATLIFGFVAYNVLKFFAGKISYKKIIQVSDLWAVFIGHLVFSAIYTRLWVHESDYLVRLKIWCRFADLVYLIASVNHFIWPLILIFALFATFYIKFKKDGLILESSLLLFVWILFFILLFPQITENIVRYWTWALGLSGKAHEAYGIVKAPSETGYFGIILRDISPVTLFGFIMGFLLAIYESWRYRTSREIKLLAIGIIFLVWTSVLSVSSKQTIRYLLPVYCLSFFLLGNFYLKLLDFLSQYIPGKFKKSFSSVYCISLILPSILITIRYFPDQMMYQNRFVDLLIHDQGARSQNYIIGLNEAYRVIRSKIKENQKVFVAGDVHALKLTHQIFSPNNKNISFSPPTSIDWGHLLVRFHAYDEAFKEFLPTKLEEHELLFSSSANDIPSISVYQIALPDLTKEFIFPMKDFYKAKGVLQDKAVSKFINDDQVDDLELKKYVAVDAANLKKGDILFGISPFFDKGNYRFSLKVNGILQNSSVPINLSASALKFKVGKCEKIFTIADIADGDVRVLKSECSFESLKPRQVVLYWFGNKSLILSNISVTKLPDS